MDSFRLLATELVEQVVDQLGRTDLLKLGRVSRRLRAIVTRHSKYALPWVVDLTSLRSTASADELLMQLAHLLGLNKPVALVFDINVQTSTASTCIQAVYAWRAALPKLDEMLWGLSDVPVVALEARCPAAFGQLLISLLVRPMPHLRDLILEARSPLCQDQMGDESIDYIPYIRPIGIPPNIFAGQAPHLQTVILRNAVLPSSSVPAFAQVRNLDYATLVLADLPHLLTGFPVLRTVALELNLIETTPGREEATVPLCGLQLSSINLRCFLSSSGEAARAVDLARILRGAITNNGDAYIQIEPDWEAEEPAHCNLAAWEIYAAYNMAMCAATLLPAQGHVSIHYAEQIIRERPVCRFLVVWLGTGRHSVTVDLRYGFGGIISDIVPAFAKHLDVSTHIKELKVDLGSLRTVSRLPSRVAQELERFTLTLRYAEVVDTTIVNDSGLEPSSQDHAREDVFMMDYSYMPFSETVNSWICEQQSQQTDNAAIHSPSTSAWPSLEIVFTTDPGIPSTLNIPPLFMHMVMEYLGFAEEGRLSRITFGRGVQMAQESLRSRSSPNDCKQ